MRSCLWLSGCDFLTVESLAEALNAQACPGATETEQRRQKYGNRKESQLRLDHTTAQTIQNTIIYQKNTWRCMLKHCFFSMCKNIDPHCILRQHVWLSHSQKLRVLEMQLRSLHVVCLQLRSSQSALQQCTLREHPQLLCQSASNGNTTWKLATLVPAAQKLAILDASRLHMWSNHSRELAPGLRITIRKSVE